MASQADHKTATTPSSGSGITDDLPPQHWVLELLFHCLTSHSERMQQLRTSKPGYDPTAAQRAIGEGQALLDRLLTTAGLISTKRELVIAYWQRGLQPDAIDAVRSGFANKIRETEENQNVLKQTFGLFMLDPQYQTENGLQFFGGAALCLQIGQAAGLDANELLMEAIQRAGRSQ